MQAGQYTAASEQAHKVVESHAGRKHNKDKHPNLVHCMPSYDTVPPVACFTKQLVDFRSIDHGPGGRSRECGIDGRPSIPRADKRPRHQLLMLEDLAASILQRLLGRYLLGIEGRNLRVAVWSGRVVLENLTLRPDAFAGLLPCCF